MHKHGKSTHSNPKIEDQILALNLIQWMRQLIMNKHSKFHQIARSTSLNRAETMISNSYPRIIEENDEIQKFRISREREFTCVEGIGRKREIEIEGRGGETKIYGGGREILGDIKE